jgi:hypothetical protein
VALNGYRDNLDAAEAQISSMPDAASKSAVLGWALDNMNEQTAYCDSIIDTGSGNLEPLLEANTLTVRTQVQLLRMLEKQDTVRAAQSNINAMQNRLQRAYDKAGEDQYRVMQQVLLQYQELNSLGEEMLQRAQNMENHRAEVEALNSEALSGYLDTLDDMYLQTPQEYRHTINASQESTLQFKIQAYNQHQSQVGSSDNTTPPPGKGKENSPAQGGQASSPNQAGNGNSNNVTQNTPSAATQDKGQDKGGSAASGNITGPQGNNGNGGGDKDVNGSGPGSSAAPDGGGTPPGEGGIPGGGDTGSGGTGPGEVPVPGDGGKAGGVKP